MKQYKPIHLLCILLIILIIGGFIVSRMLINAPKPMKVSGPNIRFANTVLSVMISDESAEQWQGLSDRQFMGAMNGMLFVFPNVERRTFVMRRMHFPLDIVWINNDQIVHIEKRLTPEGESVTKRYTSPTSANYVLEVHAGFTDAFGIKVGDRVEINQ